MSSTQRILIVGATGSSHVGGSLLRGANHLGLEARLCDVNEAWRHGNILQKVLWRFGDRRPLLLHRFERTAAETVSTFKPDTIVTTGMAPLSGHSIQTWRRKGIRVVNFSTDDPFNPQHRATWFLGALKEYDVVFTPRRSNEAELVAHGCRLVRYLPFGYDPDLFFPVRRLDEADRSDLFFAGVGDDDRLPYIAAALRAGVQVRLHGINWERYEETRAVTRGQAETATLCRAVAACKVALGLVRRSNRDGHSMRTFEVPAIGACMLMEDTAEHREFFGPEGEQVCYFREPVDMVDNLTHLLQDSVLRSRLRDAAHATITEGHHTYADRLQTMLQL